MCGIAGLLAAGSDDERRDVVSRMSAELRHRGPDDDGLWCGEDACLASRRLAIIDLPGGHQPMATEDGVVIVFNGEIYNHAALRRELEDEGCRFRTASDTEVLLRLLAREGIDGLGRIDGMFAACVVDTRRRRALLVRDRLGKKPLYYGRPEGRLLFASELKAIIPVLARRPELDLQAIHDYLGLRYVPAPATIWSGLRKLPAGHALEVDLVSGREELRRWWTLDIVSEELEPGRDYVNELDALLTSAVDERLVAADVPVGVMLSGGLDSSAVSAAAVRAGHRAFHSFAVGYERGGAHSEVGHARLVAEHLGLQHHELLLSDDDFADGLGELVWQTDEPLADLTAIPLHRLARMAAGEVKVVLSGEGADELLGGYSFDTMARSLERYRLPARLPPVLLRLGGGLPGGAGDVLGALARGGWAGYPAARGAYISRLLGEDEQSRLWRHPREGLRSTDDLVAEWYAAARSDHPVDRAQQVAAGSWLAEDLLMKADKSTMAASLELRCPFLDRDLVAWAARLPMAMKVGSRQTGWTTKRVLRELAARWLPAATIARPKQGFPVPAYDWLRDSGGAWAQERLLRDEGPFAELFDPGEVGRIVQRARGPEGTEAAHRAWALLVLQSWLDRWVG